MKLIRSASVAVLMVVAFAGAVMASTGLHQTPPLSAGDYAQDCAAPDGKVIWHFVLTQTEANEAMLTVTFGYPIYDKAVLSDKNSGGVLHFNVQSDIGDVVVGAVTTADGALLNLSHTCIGEGGPTSTPSSAPSSAPSEEPPTPSVEPSTMPSEQPSAEPTPQPSPSTSPSETPAPSLTPSPTEPTPSASSSAPATPVLTAPPTDTDQSQTTTRPGSNLFLLFAGIGFVAVAIGLSAPRSRSR